MSEHVSCDGDASFWQDEIWMVDFGEPVDMSRPIVARP
jgi:hypothetical protein